MTTRRDMLRLSAGAGLSLGLGSLGSGVWGSTLDEGKVAKAARSLKLLILGGTAFLGPEFVESAVARGHVVTLFNRGRTNPKLFPDLEKLQGDRNDAATLKVLEGRKWDAVVDTSGYVPVQVRDVMDRVAANIGYYVFISTCSVYKDNSKPNMDETAAVGALPDNVPADTKKVDGMTYGPLKALCEQAAEKAMPGRVANVRPGLIVGPGDPSDRFTYWPVRVAKGGKILAPHAPTEKVQLIDARDLGEWMVHLCENQTPGVFNALGPSPKQPLNMGAMLDACKKTSGPKDAEFVWVDEEFLKKHNVSEWMDMPAWASNRGETAGFALINNDRATKAGLKFRSIEDTAKATLDWFKTLPPERQAKLRAGINEAREKEVLKAWETRKT